MNRLILAILILFSSLSATQSWASGSNTVFLPVKSRQYYVTDALLDLVVNPRLYAYLESVQNQVYVARVSASVYNTAAHYMYLGYDVQIDFEGYEPIVFRYYSSVDAFVGFTSYGNPVILSCPNVK